MSRRRAVDMRTRYSLWGAIPSVYNSYAEDLARSLQGQLASASGAELEQIERRLTSVVATLNGQQTDFFSGFVSAFDAVLAPPHAAIEDFDLYLDPRSCPSDFLPWLASWLGLTLNQRWPIVRRRELVARAVGVFKLRGTLEGVRQAVELYTSISPVVEDNGGTTSSLEPLGPLPGTRTPQLTITVPPAVGGMEIDHELVYQIVETMKPAHVAIEVRTGQVPGAGRGLAHPSSRRS